MGCDVCIGGGYDGAETDFYSTTERVARIQHECCECKRPILPGERYERVAGKSDGDFWSYVTCSLCKEIRTVFTCGESWLFESLWDDMRLMAFPNLTTASECFTELSAAAKARVLDEWRRWKGL